MKKLKEITGIVTRKRLNKVELLTKTVLSKGEHKLAQLYDGIVEGKYNSDKDAAEDLYQSTPSDPRYKTLKNKFKKRLQNNLLYLDIKDPSYSNYDQAKYTCYKVQILKSKVENKFNLPEYRKLTISKKISSLISPKENFFVLANTEGQYGVVYDLHKSKIIYEFDRKDYHSHV